LILASIIGRYHNEITASKLWTLNAPTKSLAQERIFDFQALQTCLQPFRSHTLEFALNLQPSTPPSCNKDLRPFSFRLLYSIPHVQNIFVQLSSSSFKLRYHNIMVIGLYFFHFFCLIFWNWNICPIVNNFPCISTLLKL